MAGHVHKNASQSALETSFSNEKMQKFDLCTFLWPYLFPNISPPVEYIKLENCIFSTGGTKIANISNANRNFFANLKNCRVLFPQISF